MSPRHGIDFLPPILPSQDAPSSVNASMCAKNVMDCLAAKLGLEQQGERRGTGESRSRPKAALSDNAGEAVQSLSYCLQVSQSLNHICLAGYELSVWFSLKKPPASSRSSFQNEWL